VKKIVKCVTAYVQQDSLTIKWRNCHIYVHCCIFYSH